MSHPWGESAPIALLAPVATVAQAARCAAAGARLVDAPPHLVPAIRRDVGAVLICADHEGADLTRDAAIARRAGLTLICQGLDAAAAAVRHGAAAGRILVQTGPAGIEAATRAGWATLADLEPEADSRPGTEAAAAICAWLGASVLRTRHVAGVRRSVAMTEAIAGRRPPAFAVRGLA